MPPFTRLVVPDRLLAEVVECARREVPLECCGLLAGRVTDGVAAAAAYYPVANAAASETEYETDATDMFRAFRSMREHGIELVAVYHSHPESEPVPSRRDIDRNTYGESVVHLIVGLAGEEADVRAWWLTETGFREAELHVTQI